MVPQPQELYFAAMEYTGYQRSGFPDPKFCGCARRIYLGRDGSLSRSSVDGRGAGRRRLLHLPESAGLDHDDGAGDRIAAASRRAGAARRGPASALYPNAKNLYVRLLAETGLVGFILFWAFQLFILGDTIAALKQRAALWRYLGIAALFSWLGIIFYNMTQDSFATPNIWLNLGIFIGMSVLSLQTTSKAL